MFEWLFKKSNNNLPILKKIFKKGTKEENLHQLITLNFVQDGINSLIEGNIIKNIENYTSNIFNKLKNFYDNWGNINDIKKIINKKVNIIYFFGNNGIGKTTSIVNLSIILKDMGYKILLIAADEFRGGAVEQLVTMAEKNNIPVYSSLLYSKEPSLPQIIFEGIEKNYQDYDVILIDTAGRSHMDPSLLDNLKKQYDIAHKVLKNIDEKNIISIWVNDGNIVNGFHQQKNFFEKIPVDYIIMTKIKNNIAYYNFLYIMEKINKPIIFYGPNVQELIIFNDKVFMEKLS